MVRAKVGDTIRLICDAVPGVTGIKTKGMIVKVHQAYDDGSITVSGKWQLDDGRTQFNNWSFSKDDYEPYLEQDFKPPTTRELNAAKKRLLALAEELNGSKQD